MLLDYDNFFANTKSDVLSDSFKFWKAFFLHSSQSVISHAEVNQ